MKYFWFFYIGLLSFNLAEKVFHLFREVTIGDAFEFSTSALFLLSAVIVVYKQHVWWHSILISLASIMFIFQQSVLNMAYYFGEQLKFYVISVSLGLVFVLPVLIVAFKPLFAKSEIKSQG